MTVQVRNASQFLDSQCRPRTVQTGWQIGIIPYTIHAVSLEQNNMSLHYELDDYDLDGFTSVASELRTPMMVRFVPLADVAN